MFTCCVPGFWARFDRIRWSSPDQLKNQLLSTSHADDSSNGIDRGDTWEDGEMPRSPLKKRRKSGKIASDSVDGQTSHGTGEKHKSSPWDLDFREVDRVNISFAGCGFLGIYHLGVAKTLICNGPRFLERVDSFGGASAGSLIASIFAMDGGKEEQLKFIEAGVDFCYKSASTVSRQMLGILTPGFNLLAGMEELLNEKIPENGHELANKKLFVSITESKKNRIITEFESKQHVIKCLLGSSYIPHVTGSETIRWNEEKFTDGGLSDNLPMLPNTTTITVSPFSGNQHICPRDKRRHVQRRNVRTISENVPTAESNSEASAGSHQHDQVDSIGVVDNQHRAPPSDKTNRPRRRLSLTINKMDVDVKVRNILRGKHCLFPPSAKQMRKYFDRGVYDATEFLIHHDLWTNDGSSGNVKDDDETRMDSEPSDGEHTVETNANNHDVVDGLSDCSSRNKNNVVFESGV